MTVRKTIALWLVLLALSPFTAPFSTCDLSALSTGDSNQSAPAAKLITFAQTAVDALLTSHSQELPAAGRTRFVVRSAAACLPQPVAPAGIVSPRSPHPSSSLCHATDFTLLRI